MNLKRSGVFTASRIMVSTIRQQVACQITKNLRLCRFFMVYTPQRCPCLINCKIMGIVFMFSIHGTYVQQYVFYANYTYTIRTVHRACTYKLCIQYTQHEVHTNTDCTYVLHTNCVYSIYSMNYIQIQNVHMYYIQIVHTVCIYTMYCM